MNTPTTTSRQRANSDAPIGTGWRMASRMAGVRAYRPPTADPRVDLWLDANEGPVLDDRLMRTLDAVSPEMLRRYPDASALERAIAECFGVDPARVVVTNGGDDAIDRLCRVTLEPGRELLRHTPSFAMIEHSARLAGGTTNDVPWNSGPFPADALIKRITDNTGLVAMVTPNNPTGLTIDTPDLLRVVDAAARMRSAALVDLAYVEFADADPTPALLDRPNAVLVRTFSKAFGLAGLRVGYAIAPADMAEPIRAAGGPYPVSGVSLALAAAALERRDDRAAAIERIRFERARLIDQIPIFGFHAMPSQANFVLVRCVNSAQLHARLLARGISVRAFGFEPSLRDALRITLPGNPAAFERLLDALRGAAGELAGHSKRPQESNA